MEFLVGLVSRINSRLHYTASRHGRCASAVTMATGTQAARSTEKNVELDQPADTQYRLSATSRLKTCKTPANTSDVHAGALINRYTKLPKYSKLFLENEEAHFLLFFFFTPYVVTL